MQWHPYTFRHLSDISKYELIFLISRSNYCTYHGVYNFRKLAVLNIGCHDFLFLQEERWIKPVFIMLPCCYGYPSRCYSKRTGWDYVSSTRCSFLFLLILLVIFYCLLWLFKDATSLTKIRFKLSQTLQGDWFSNLKLQQSERTIGTRTVWSKQSCIGLDRN